MGEDFERMEEESGRTGTGLGGRKRMERKKRESEEDGNGTRRGLGTEQNQDFEEGETRTLRRAKTGL